MLPCVFKRTQLHVTSVGQLLSLSIVPTGKKFNNFPAFILREVGKAFLLCSIVHLFCQVLRLPAASGYLL